MTTPPNLNTALTELLEEHASKNGTSLISRPLFSGALGEDAVRTTSAELRTVSSKAPLTADSLRDAMATAMSFTVHNPNPVITERWLFRPFVLTEHTMSWGSYTVPAPGGLAWHAVSEVAMAFSEQMLKHTPNQVSAYLAESNALWVYEQARKTLQRVVDTPGCTIASREAERGRAQAAMENALLAVFYAARRLHWLDAGVIEYSGLRSRRHVIIAADECTRYECVFKPDTLELDFIANEDTGVIEWSTDSWMRKHGALFK